MAFHRTQNKDKLAHLMAPFPLVYSQLHLMSGLYEII